MKQGWIGVDLDGTLAQYQFKEVWDGSIGAPIPLMVDRVKQWLSDGKDVRIMTARVGEAEGITDGPRETETQRSLITDWLVEHIGQALPITATKDYFMKELWDDRAIQVEINTGRRVDGQP